MTLADCVAQLIRVHHDHCLMLDLFLNNICEPFKPSQHYTCSYNVEEFSLRFKPGMRYKQSIRMMHFITSSCTSSLNLGHKHWETFSNIWARNVCEGESEMRQEFKNRESEDQEGKMKWIKQSWRFGSIWSTTKKTSQSPDCYKALTFFHKCHTNIS